MGTDPASEFGFERFFAPARFSAQNPSLSRPRRLHPNPAPFAGFPKVLALCALLTVLGGCAAADTLTEDFKDSIKTVGNEVESASQKAGDEVQKFGAKVGNGAEKFSDELKK